MDEKEIITLEQGLSANTYAKRPVVITKGRGVIVWDINDTEYIDCTGSYGVCILGHSHPKIQDAIRKQLNKIISCHGSFYNDVRAELLKKIVQITPKPLDTVFLGNTGAEAVECAIKLARKHTNKSEIIAMTGGYHGKTMGALSATWKKKYREPFKPLIPDIKHVPRYNIEKLKTAISKHTAAVIVEPIQGEGGIRIPQEGYLQQLRELCDTQDIVLIFDEVQTGFGRTGKMFACEHWSVIPDILCLAKSAAGGLPIGLTVANETIMASLKVGDHTSTFGGTPIVCAAACATIDVLLEEKLPEKAAQLGQYFMENLNQIKNHSKSIREVRGLGLMIGVELRYDIYNILLKSLNQGILILDAGRNILRFLPPLIINKPIIDQVVSILDGIIGEEEHERLRS